MEADLDMYFGDDFGQKIDLTVRIREILRNYPEGTSIFKEMVQNADDAGATEVNFCLDYRQHGSDKLAYTKLKPFQVLSG
uniref:Sacsin/Nov domain-containing protein n=1 Tax=Globisporangium ultimum (strain ATCC 200006 / CBS 805.95 / DAOM BR144) TaxID=431595 RepID=K3WEQ3_GLOUD